MQLAPRTVVAVMSLLGLIYNGLLTAIHWRRRAYSGYCRWLCAGPLTILSLFLLTLRPSAPDWISILVANAVLLVASILYFEGAREFRGLAPRSGLVYAASAGVIASLAFFLYVVPSLNARALVMSAFLAFVFIRGGMAVLGAVTPGGRFGLRLTGVVSVLAGATLGLRAAYMLIGPPLDDLFALSGIHGAMSVLVLIEICFLPIGFILIADERAISDLNDVQEKAMGLQESLREGEERQTFLLKLSDALRPLTSPAEIQATAVTLLGERLQLTRVNYADIEGDECVIRYSWVSGSRPFSGRRKITIFGEVLLDEFRRGETVVVNDVGADPRVTEAGRTAFLAMDMAAFAGAIQIKAGHGASVFCAESATPRVWTRREVDLIRDVAERTWEAVERARATAALRVSEHKFRLSLQAAHLGTWKYDLESDVFTPDEAGKVMHGLDPDEVVETLEVARRNISPDDIAMIQRTFRRAAAERQTFSLEYRVILPGGETRWVASLGTAQPGTSLLFGVVQDVTARKRVELELEGKRREQERTLRLLLESASQGILSVDARGVIVMVNASTEEMFGWGRGELVGQSVEQLLPHGFRTAHAAHRAAYFGEPQPRPMGVGRDLVGQRKDGSTFPVEISLNHVNTADGGHAIAFVTDISARKQAEDALLRSHDELERRSLQLSRLASQLTLAEQHAREQLARTLHDGLQQLLFSAAVTLDRAVKGAPHNDQDALLQKARADVDEAMEAARTLSVNLFPPVLHVGGLPAALAWLARRTKEQYRVEVNLKSDPRANPEANDVRILLFGAVRELLFNAVKHAQVDRVEIALELAADGAIQIHVTDQGIGFDPTAAPESRNQRQAGLGLFSIQERLALIGGRLDIESAPGKGARFSLILPSSELPHFEPVVEAPAASSPRERRPAPRLPGGPGKCLRILIADDHMVARAGLRELLTERPGLQVVGEAANGIDAIAQAAALQPDVIVMDVSMPRMNGIEATREIHGAHPGIQIVGLSTHDDENIERSMREAGAGAYFTKNEGADRLLDHLLMLSVQAHGVSGIRQAGGDSSTFQVGS